MREETGAETAPPKAKRGTATKRVKYLAVNYPRVTKRSLLRALIDARGSSARRVVGSGPVSLGGRDDRYFCESAFYRALVKRMRVHKGERGFTFAHTHTHMSSSTSTGARARDEGNRGYSTARAHSSSYRTRAYIAVSAGFAGRRHLNGFMIRKTRAPGSAFRGDSPGSVVTERAGS